MPLVSAAPCIERTGVIAGFVLSAGSGLTPTITKGLLFAQDEMYRPAAAPELPEAAPNQQSWLYYNSAAGFYWADTPAPYVADDAFVGWILAGAAEIRAVSAQQIQTETAEDSPAVLPVIVQQQYTPISRNVVLFKAGRSNGDGTFEQVMYWDATRGMMLIDWGCLAPSDTSNWTGLQIWLKLPDGEAFKYAKASGTIGLDQFAEAEDGSRYRYDTLAVQLESIPEDPEQWVIIAASVDAGGTLSVDEEGNPSGPSVALMTLDKSDYAEDFDAIVVTQGTEGGETLWGIASIWENPPVPRYVKTRIMLLDYGFVGNVQQLSGENPLTDLSSECGYWPWPTPAQNVRVVIQSIFGDGTIAPIAECPYVDLTVGRTLGNAGQEYTPVVTGFSATVSYPEQADGTIKAVVSCAFTKSSNASWGALAIKIKPSGGAWSEIARGSETPIQFTLPVGIVATTYTLGAFSVDTFNRVNSYQAGVTPTQDIIVGNAAGQLDLTKVKATTYDPDIFKVEDGKFKVWAMNGSLIVTGSISSAALNATAINVGGGGSKPGKFAVYNAAGTQIGFIGVEGAYEGAWFKQLAIGGASAAAPKIVANSSGAVSMSDASVTVTSSVGGESHTAVLDPASSVAAFRLYRTNNHQMGLYPYGLFIQGHGTAAQYPVVSLSRSSADASIYFWGDAAFQHYVAFGAGASAASVAVNGGYVAADYYVAAGTTGFTGTVANPASITVVGGIVTAVS